RHTRFKCDWSSDVCSSDLGVLGDLGAGQCSRPPARPAARSALGGESGLRGHGPFLARRPSRAAARRAGKDARLQAANAPLRAHRAGAVRERIRRRAGPGRGRLRRRQAGGGPDLVDAVGFVPPGDSRDRGRGRPHRHDTVRHRPGGLSVRSGERQPGGRRKPDLRRPHPAPRNEPAGSRRLDPPDLRQRGHRHRGGHGGGGGARQRRRRGGDGPRSTLDAYVQRQLWKEVATLHQQDGDSRVYRVHRDELGRATLIFGDGVQGARLPTGRDNVVATYRTGMLYRTVAAGGLSLLATRPLGLDAVANPMPSTPGAPAESREEIRSRAPRKLYTLGRIVSLRDFEDFALDYSGIDKAGAWGMIAEGGRMVQLTLAAPGGVPIPGGSALISDLLNAIQSNRAFDSPVLIQSYRPVRVLVEASIQVMPGFLWDDVRKDVLARVADAFSFTRARFGGGISAASVVSVMQSVRGVQAVDLESFSWAGRGDDGDDAGGAGGGGDPRERRAAPPSLD